MKYRCFLLSFSLFISILSHSQTLFTYGSHSVDASEFLRAYNKVNTIVGVNKEKAVRSYLDLYINSKLKIREAIERGYDTLPVLKDELSALRSQVIENYMTDPFTINQLMDEAFVRSQKDISTSHIFIPYNAMDSVTASATIKRAYSDLLAGKKFEEVAKLFSLDPNVSKNGGFLGYLTVFSLPYEFENIVYSLSAGKFSAPYKSAFGYHIFRNNAERKAIGRMKAAHILFAFPPGSDDAAKKRLRKLADSVYASIKKGGDFTRLALQFSNDYVSNASGAQMREITTGTYDPVFENVLFNLQKNGDISAPFETTHGYHIVQRIALAPIPATKDKKTMDDLKIRVENDSRINLSKQRLYNRIVANVSFNSTAFDQKQLFAFADSLIDFKKPAEPIRNINNQTVLFSLGDKTKKAFDYVNFAINNRYLLDGSAIKPGMQIYDEFRLQAAFDYYRDHLEEFDTSFRNQMNDFREGNLFFEIMMQQIWGPAQNDSIGQRAYYEKNRTKFAWSSSADAVIFYAGDVNIAKQLHAAIKRSPRNWREVSQHYGDRATVDSSRFEIVRIPGLGSMPPRAGLLTAIVKNKNDNSTAFAYIIKVYPKPSAKTFAQAKADVITGYQDEMEAKWIMDLKKKYPVKINEGVLQNLIK